MPLVTTMRAHTTVHANWDLLETEETAAKVRTRRDITWPKVYNQVIELAKVK